MTMTEKYILIFTALFVALCIILVFLRAKLQNARQEAKRKAVIRQMLEKAQEQNEMFDMKMLDDEAGQKGLSGMLLKSADDGLHMEVLAYVAKEWADTPVDVYFRVTLPEGAVFYKFRSRIRSLNPEREKSRLILTAPLDLEVGQKRNFIRVKPRKDSVRVIGIWAIDPANPIPKTTAEIGRPVLHYKLGMETEPVQVENISATGMALRFFMESPQDKPVDLDTGSRLLCLVIYAMDKSEKLITFWCTCEVVNTRLQEEPGVRTDFRRGIHQLGRAGTGQVRDPLVPQLAFTRSGADYPVGHAYGSGTAETFMNFTPGTRRQRRIR